MGKKKSPVTKEKLIEILEKKIQDPDVSPRDLASLSKRLANLRGFVKQGEYRRLPAQSQPEPSKPLAPPQPDDSTPEEKALLAKAEQSWREWSKDHRQESADFLMLDLHEKYQPQYLDSLAPTEREQYQARIQVATAKWRECWAEYDMYYQQQTSHSFFGSK